MTKLKKNLITAVTAAAAIAAVVLSSSETTHKSCNPAPGAGVMGSCAAQNVHPTGPLQGAIRGKFCPDVSEFQGDPNWAAAKRHGLTCAIVRVNDAITGVPDRSLSYNARELNRLHIWHGYYTFLRPGGCATEARVAYEYITRVGGLTSGPEIADAEVPLNSNCTRSFTGEIRVLSRWNVGVEYSSTGTNPGGGNPQDKQWDAAYGPSPECFMRPCHRVAWQFTDGQIGPVPHCTAGLCGDISRDEGLTQITRVKPRSHPRPKPGPNPALVKLLAERQRTRAHLVHAGCRVRRPRRACTPLFLHGRRENEAIRKLGGK